MFTSNDSEQNICIVQYLFAFVKSFTQYTAKYLYMGEKSEPIFHVGFL